MSMKIPASSSQYLSMTVSANVVAYFNSKRIMNKRGLSFQHFLGQFFVPKMQLCLNQISAIFKLRKIEFLRLDNLL